MQYYEAIYLMKRFLQRLPQSQDQLATRKLVQQKTRHYEQVAQALMTSDNSSSAALLSTDPRSPIEKETFFQADSSVLPIPAPPYQSPLMSQQTTTTTTRIMGQANQKLACALDLDEAADANGAITAYMQAAELYLQGLQQLSENDDSSSSQAVHVMRRRLESTLDRVEQLKHPTRPSPEKTKTRIPDTRQADSQNVTSDASALTAAEIEILKQSSLIASGLFLPWAEQDATRLLAEARNPHTPLFTDTDGFLPLSENQKKHFFRWARPSEIVRLRSAGSRRPPQRPVLVRAITPYTIRQQYVTDCSFVASLCICAALERRFQKRLITATLFPRGNHNNNKLVYNPAGKYMVKLWLNGVARCVVIDDYLPIDKYGNLLCSQSSSTHDPTHLELWVCLIEKAFLKLAGGGYGFPGSNSGVDMFALTGWIPESIIFAKNNNNNTDDNDTTALADYETHPERAWERIHSACSYGDCLITVSSSTQLTESDADAIGIVTGHAYAVLSVMETKNGTRLLQLKNPWAHKGWKGRYSSRDAASWRDPKFREEVGYNPDVAMKQDDGVFWICWQDVLRYFKNFHLSWNPGLFSHRTTVHDVWRKEQGPEQDTFNVGENPQFFVELSDKSIARNPSIWILLSRHVTKQEQLEGKVRFKDRQFRGRSGNTVLLTQLLVAPCLFVQRWMTTWPSTFIETTPKNNACGTLD